VKDRRQKKPVTGQGGGVEGPAWHRTTDRGDQRDGPAGRFLRPAQPRRDSCTPGHQTKGATHWQRIGSTLWSVKNRAKTLWASNDGQTPKSGSKQSCGTGGVQVYKDATKTAEDGVRGEGWEVCSTSNPSEAVTRAQPGHVCPTIKTSGHHSVVTRRTGRAFTPRSAAPIANRPKQRRSVLEIDP